MARAIGTAPPITHDRRYPSDLAVGEHFVQAKKVQAKKKGDGLHHESCSSQRAMRAMNNLYQID